MTRAAACALFIATLLAGAPAWARHRHAALAGEQAPPATTVTLGGAVATVAFSPNGDGTRVIVEEIGRARHQVLVQAYGFTSWPIERALVAARERGVDVEAIFDKSTLRARYSRAQVRDLAAHGVPIWDDLRVSIAHNKVMVVDGDDVITGSFNFTQAAQRRNAENVLLIRGAAALARAYRSDWRWRQRFSLPFDRTAQALRPAARVPNLQGD